MFYQMAIINFVVLELVDQVAESAVEVSFNVPHLEKFVPLLNCFDFASTKIFFIGIELLTYYCPEIWSHRKTTSDPDI